MGSAVKSKRRQVRRRLIIAAVSVLAVGMTVGSGGKFVRQVLSGQSLSDLLSGRSPGERGPASLIKIKRVASNRSGVTPQQRVLPMVRSRVPDDALALGGAPLLPDIAFGEPFFELVTVPSDNLFGGGPAIGAPGGFTVFPPGNFGLVPPGNSGVVPPGTVTPTPPVPEPATWLTLILGFALAGGALRRGRARAVATTVGTVA